MQPGRAHVINGGKRLRLAQSLVIAIRLAFKGQVLQANGELHIATPVRRVCEYNSAG